MLPREIATISFKSAPSGDEDGVVIIRAAPGVVGVAVSLEHDGDAHAYLTTKDARRVLDALQIALGEAETH